jgi:DNA (cytosine-5)-methyltransferase 1
MIKVGSDFSGVGAFNQALMRLGIDYEEVFACDMDKYARQTFIHNYGEPEYYPTNVYDREIPSKSIDIYMTSPPCQAFSLAGKRLGKDDQRGILFFNSHEFIQVNKPRYFIFENVKGLLSDDGGKTFSEWVNLLGGKSVNGLPMLFPYEDSVPYHLYWKVLNAKEHGVPQNRERVFLVGIRDDSDNNFRFPVEEHLTKRLKDVLEEEVFEKYYLSNERINTISNSNRGIGWTDADKKDAANCIISGYNKQPTDGEYIKTKSNLDKYYLSEKMIEGFTKHNKNHNKKGTGFIFEPKDENQIANCLRANAALNATDNSLKIKSATTKGYEEAMEGDSINFSVPNSQTRRGRVEKGVAQTLDTGCQQGVWIADYRNDEGLRIRKDNISPCMAARKHSETDISTMDPIIGYDYKIRRLTPRECFRLMDFPDTFTWPVSDSQAYKQAGNSIVVNVLYKILKNMNL